MKRQSILLVATFSFFVLSNPLNSKAQQQSTNLQLTKQFREGFLTGCLQGKTPGVKNQGKYCTCMANSYQSRYDGRTLDAISQVAGRLGNQGPALVNLMVAPEAKVCQSKF
jgi:hypothetical protein